MIRVLVVDDHPAVLTGLLVALRCEPDIEPVAGVSSGEEAIAEARSAELDVALQRERAELDGRMRAIFKRLRRRSPSYVPGVH